MENVLTLSNICTTVYVLLKIYLDTRKAQRFKKKKELSSFISVMDRNMMKRFINTLIANGNDEFLEEDEDGKNRHLMKLREREIEKLGQRQLNQDSHQADSREILANKSHKISPSKNEDVEQELFGDAKVHPVGSPSDDSRVLRYHGDIKISKPGFGQRPQK